ncbi:MAG: winged helix-turn-helix transcriptional regulator [Bacteroidales bacterium]|nr:winged helix-turn-helix transcriptional regulator [Bacteroidales bacterium]
MRFVETRSPFIHHITFFLSLLNESQREIFEYIRVNKGCNTTAIAKGLGKPFRTIDKHINTLLQLGLIERRGGKRTGGYYIK